MMESLWKRNPTNLLFAAIWMGLSYLVGNILYGASDARLAFVLPGICAVAFFFRTAIFFRLFPFFLFGLIAIKFHFGSRFSLAQLSQNGTEATVLGLVTLIAIAIGARLQTLLVPTHQKVVTQRMTYAPTKMKPGRTPFAPSYFVSLLFIVGAWWLAGYWNSDFAWATKDPDNFNTYRQSLKQGIQLVPWAFNAIRLTIYLAMIFALTHGVLSYLRCRYNNGQMGAMLLRHELWMWNRWEQKAVAKAARKNK